MLPITLKTRGQGDPLTSLFASKGSWCQRTTRRATGLIYFNPPLHPPFASGGTVDGIVSPSRSISEAKRKRHTPNYAR